MTTTTEAKQPPASLQQLRMERDAAYRRAMAGVDSARGRVESLDVGVESLVQDHPMLAVGGAAAAGLGAGLVLGGASARHLIKAAGLMVLRPVAINLAQSLLVMGRDK